MNEKEKQAQWSEIFESNKLSALGSLFGLTVKEAEKHLKAIEATIDNRQFEKIPLSEITLRKQLPREPIGAIIMKKEELNAREERAKELFVDEYGNDGKMELLRNIQALANTYGMESTIQALASIAEARKEYHKALAIALTASAYEKEQYRRYSKILKALQEIT